MHQRFHTKQEETAFLAKEYAAHPELFSQRTFTEDAQTLEEFGIYIPNKEQFVPGTLKLWPEDFIVEEIGNDGAIESVGMEKHTLPQAPAPTIFATLVKCGVSTLEAIEDIAHTLGIEKTALSFAGIKDKDALTAQKISIRNSNLEALHKLHSPYFFLKNITTGKGIVEKGRLRGNRFTVLIRSPKSLAEGPGSQHVAEALERVNKNGFYNFFYLQRFGTPRLRNYYWAQQILLGNYEKAVHDLLTYPAPRELDYFKQLRGDLTAHWGNWNAIIEKLDPFPVIFVHERKVVEHLLHKPSDFAGALAAIPDQITLWIYALTSLLFNEKISECISIGKELPKELPFALSLDRNDTEIYRTMLERLDLYPLPLKNLRPFPNIQLKSRTSPTKERARILKGEITDEGLVLQFELSKGQYATTFLSHIFNLVSGFPPSDIRKERVHTTDVLGEPSLDETLAHFKEATHTKGENVFENFSEKNE